MTTTARRHLASSPFAPEPEAIVEKFEVGDLVSHDSRGMGRVIQLQQGAVLVDFSPEKLRITSPFRGMSRI